MRKKNELSPIIRDLAVSFLGSILLTALTETPTIILATGKKVTIIQDLRKAQAPSYQGYSKTETPSTKAQIKALTGP